jgi:hypothetical protein
MSRKVWARKAGYWAITVLEILLLAVSFALDYFTRKKMGMARYVSYVSHSIETKYPMEMLARISMVILASFAIAVLLLYWIKRERMNAMDYAAICFMVVLTVWYMWFAWSKSAAAYRPYYPVGALCALVAAIDILKAGTLIFLRCRQKRLAGIEAVKK